MSCAGLDIDAIHVQPVGGSATGHSKIDIDTVRVVCNGAKIGKCRIMVLDEVIPSPPFPNDFGPSQTIGRQFDEAVTPHAFAR